MARSPDWQAGFTCWPRLLEHVHPDDAQDPGQWREGFIEGLMQREISRARAEIKLSRWRKLTRRWKR